MKSLLLFWIPAFAGMTVIMLILEAATGWRFSHALIAKVRFHYELPYYLNFYLRNYWFLLLLSLYGFFNAPKEQKKIYWLVFLPIIGYLCALSFLTDIVHYRYLFAPIAGLFVTGAAGAIALLSSFQKFVTPSLSKGAPSVIPANAGIQKQKNVLTVLDPRSWSGMTRKIIPAFAGMTIIIIIFFLTGEGIIAPKTFYSLESDPYDAGRPSWVYTPQPNFNKAYAYIKANLKPNDIVVSSHPHFNKIFLNQPGYWIKYDYLGLDNVPDTTKNNKEYYVGAETINNLSELQALMSKFHGYIVYDYMSSDGRIPQAMLDYISLNATQVFFDDINTYSQIWVYKF